jgi:neutral ceramidase
MSSTHSQSSTATSDHLLAGAAAVEITPSTPVFLFGYPHVARTSTGVHDPLLCSALVLDNGRVTLGIVSCDLLYIPGTVAVAARARIAAATGIPPAHVMVTATHTHSGPVTISTVPSSADPVVPPVDQAYLARVADGIVAAVVSAYETRRPAALGFAVADGTGIGTNRHLPTGPCDLRVPVLLARDVSTRRAIALLELCAMHPTVLHEDSTLISGDFPGLARQALQQRVLHAPCPVLHLTGAAGNQSPRHVTRANTFAEAARIGALLADAIGRAVAEVAFDDAPHLAAKRTFVDLPLRSFPDVPQAAEALAAAATRVQRLRSSGAPHSETRTAECDWFGAEKTLVLARAAADGRVATAAQACLPAEVQVLTVGPWSLVGWPGEAFVEYALRLASAQPDAFLVTLANGELQGYLVTPEAAGSGAYEAGNSLFGPTSGGILLARTLELLG